MKKCFLFSSMLCLAMSLNAQTQEKLKLSDLVQHPELLTPEIAFTLSKYRPDAEGYLPPIVAGPYNLRDSFYNYSWNVSQSAWDEKTKNYQTRDCDSGRLLTELNKAKDNSTGLFVNKNFSEYGWYPNGKTQNYYRYTWDNDVPNGWVQITYDTSNQDGNSLESWFKTWDQTDNVYVSGDRYILNYDASGNLITSHEFELEPNTSTWLATYNSTYSYSNGNIAVTVTDGYDLNSNTWVPIYREEYTYNGQGQLVSILYQDDFGNGLTNSRLVTMTYNSAGLLEEQVRQIYDLGAWQNNDRFTKTYYPSNADKLQLDFEWSNNQQVWVETGWDSLDESGNRLYRINKLYDEQANEYYGGYLFEYIYDNSDLLVQAKTSQLVSGTQNDWENFNLSTYSYDANGQTQEAIGKKWDTNIGDYVNLTRTYNFNTGCLFNSTSTTTAKQATCYHANPIMLSQPIYCTAFENNEELDLSLYSMTGTLINRSAFRSGEALSAGAGVSPGMYVLYITNKKGVSYRAKLVVVE